MRLDKYQIYQLLKGSGTQARVVGKFVTVCLFQDINRMTYSAFAIYIYIGIDISVYLHANEISVLIQSK